MSSDKKYAFYDLDHTLLPYDTQLLFCNFILKKYRWRLFFMFFILPLLPFCAFIGGRKLMKRGFLSFLFGIKKEQLNEDSKNFAKYVCEDLCYKKILESVESHRKNGCILVLNTASPDIYAKHISNFLAFDYCFSTKVQEYNRMPFFPKILGNNNKEEAKIPPMKKVFTELNDISKSGIEGSYSYSDSITDVPLLELAEFKVLINPSSRFRDWGEKNSAKIYTFRDLVSDKNYGVGKGVSKVLNSARLLFGFY